MAEETTPTPAPADNASAKPDAGPPNGVDPAFWALGEKEYNIPGSCVTCHQPGGSGLTGAFPPLANSEWVVGPVENVIRIQMRGLHGEIKVGPETYNSVMPPMAAKSDEEIAAVITYIRNSFGNSASAVTPEMVAEYRGEVGKPMLTVADLIDPLTAPVTKAVVETLAPAITAEIPKAQIYKTFPMTSLAIVFLVVVAGAAAKVRFLEELRSHDMKIVMSELRIFPRIGSSLR